MNKIGYSGEIKWLNLVIHIVGASDSGTYTLGQKISSELGCELDADDLNLNNEIIKNTLGNE